MVGLARWVTNFQLIFGTAQCSKTPVDVLLLEVESLLDSLVPPQSTTLL